MTTRKRPSTSASRHPPEPDPSDETIYNIIPLNNHPTLINYPYVSTAMAALQEVDDLRTPPSILLPRRYDLMDWLGGIFGFQHANVLNQREHIVLHLANAQMRVRQPTPNTIDDFVLRFRRKLLSNYTHWCSFLGCNSVIRTSHSRSGISASDLRRELLYVSLYLLIWGESANLRFMPECICYVFHHMALELNMTLDDAIDESTGQLFSPDYAGENAFLNRVVTPIYDLVKAEVKKSRQGTASYPDWRNYDDINEFFWSRSCFDELKWPIDVRSNFFVTTSRVKKMGFVEQRSFWNLFRSFDRLWIMLILFLQAAIIVASEEEKTLRDNKDIHVRLLTVFITWSVLRFVKSLLDAVMQYKLVSKETLWVGVRMGLKGVTCAIWIIVFGVYYARIWNQKNDDHQWSVAANRKVVDFHMAALVFIIPELLALALFLQPWVPSFLDDNKRFLTWVTWWWESQCFVGRGPRQGLLDKIKYSLFWIVVLSTKFCFSYFMQIKPLIQPTRDFLELSHVSYEGRPFNGSSIKFAVGLLWLPVILIYLMDLQIWYLIYSSVLGLGVGLLSHLGEIQNMQQLKLMFQYVASAIQFNFMPQEQPLDASLRGSKLQDVVDRLKLRFEFDRPLKKLESNQVEARKFAFIWNEIILAFREEDIVSDHEVELLEVPENTWNVSVVRWPCLLLCNEIHLAISQAKDSFDATDEQLWYKITKNEYRRCAVMEAYHSVKSLLLNIINSNRPEHYICTALFQKIEDSIKSRNFTKTFNMLTLANVHAKLIILVKLLIKSKKDVMEVTYSLQALYELVVKDFLKVKRNVDQLKEEGLAPRMPLPGARRLFENAVELPDSSNDIFYRHVRRLHTILTSRNALGSVPLNLEARRRILFFSNSMFMNIPRSPQLEKMMAFSVLTPYHDEEVVFAKEQLSTQNEDGVSMLYYLQTLYPDEWRNFTERMERMSEEELKRTTKSKEQRLWASYRGQTFSRTVRGMMYYHRALKFFARLDSESDTRRRDALCSMKYTYVVAYYRYGIQKARNHQGAQEISGLMKTHKALRVAYVDEVPVGDGKEYYSVLVKYDRNLEKEVEIYRVKLPGFLQVMKAKPENQNLAIIFTRGDALQTIDAYQDNNFEEALKIKNLLQEFQCDFYGIKKPTILGVRESIFTSSVSSLARFISAQETTLVTSGQRVLANPLKIRSHFGHPDVFNRFWFLTRGGIGKASRIINSSHANFAGFNCTIRGGNISHHEYIQVGKGKDFGFNQVSMSEARVACGSAEQVLSRDVYRLGHKLDFFRMLSFFYSTVGCSFNVMIISLTVYVFLWGRLYMALHGVESYVADANRVLEAILNQQFIIQLGLFTALPMLLENILQLGLLSAIWEFIKMQLQLSSIFFTFSLGTRARYFGRTILHGRTKIWPPEQRGFVVQHKTFADNYRHYARTHFVNAIELGLILTVYAHYSPVAKGTFTYIAITVPSWFVVFSWIMAPFIFNPSGFDWLKTVYDFEDFMKWIWFDWSFFAKSEQCWEIWWYKEQEHWWKAGLSGKLLEFVLSLRFFFFQYGIVYRLGIAANSKSINVYLLSWIYIVLVVGVFWIIAYARRKYGAKRHVYYRLVQTLIIVFGSAIIIVLKAFTHMTFLDLLTSQLAFIPTGWGFLLIAQVFRPILKKTVIWTHVVYAARMYEILLGMIVLAPVAILSWMPGFQLMQTRILFNDAFSKGLSKFQLKKFKPKF